MHAQHDVENARFDISGEMRVKSAAYAGDCSGEAGGKNPVAGDGDTIDCGQYLVLSDHAKAHAQASAIEQQEACEYRSQQAIDQQQILQGVDVIFGCVDNDGARVVLNEIALAYDIPFFDLGVGIEAKEGHVEAAGGRLATVLPGGPCLYCMNQIDTDEARYWLSTEEQREFMRRQGYVAGMNIAAPSVVALNAALAAAAGS